jgi:mannose-6-phosphate isomerase
MPDIFELKNVIQNYSWGDSETLSKLFNISNPAREPMAELWMGAHHKGESKIILKDSEATLTDFINSAPESILGKKVVEKFNTELPFLFKVLSAAEPLSIQVHPTKKQAIKGYEYENSLKIPLNAFERNFKDKNHKPELIYAITNFTALNGFRDLDDIINDLEKLNIPLVRKALDKLEDDKTPKGLKHFYTWLMTLDKNSKDELLLETKLFCKKYKQQQPFKLFLFLNNEYPEDIGAMCALILNFIELQPGEAMYLKPGQLHSYIHGTAMEIMANSDNVLRGGLTKKFINIKELLENIDFSPNEISLVKPQKVDKVYSNFKTPADDFELSVLDIKDSEYAITNINSAEIIFCAKGAGSIEVDGKFKELKVGISYFIPAYINEYKITGEVLLYKASVPLID